MSHGGCNQSNTVNKAFGWNQSNTYWPIVDFIDIISSRSRNFEHYKVATISWPLRCSMERKLGEVVDTDAVCLTFFCSSVTGHRAPMGAPLTMCYLPNSILYNYIKLVRLPNTWQGVLVNVVVTLYQIQVLCTKSTVHQLLPAQQTVGKLAYQTHRPHPMLRNNKNSTTMGGLYPIDAFWSNLHRINRWILRFDCGISGIDWLSTSFLVFTVNGSFFMRILSQRLFHT